MRMKLSRISFFTRTYLGLPLVEEFLELTEVKQYLSHKTSGDEVLNISIPSSSAVITSRGPTRFFSQPNYLLDARFLSQPGSKQVEARHCLSVIHPLDLSRCIVLPRVG